MIKPQISFFPWVLVACLTLLVSGLANAQSAQDVLQKNKEAMDEYDKLEIDAALNVLKDAEQLCLDNSILGAPLARTYVNMGMVQFGGNGDNAAAMELFKKALCQDESIKLDPLNSTPDMNILFTGATAQVKAEGCDGVGPAASVDGEAPVSEPMPVPAEVPTVVAPPVQIVNDVLRHTPVVQQARLIPIPFHVVTNPDVAVGSVVLFYRTQGERIFQQLQLVSKAQGWSAYIECDVLTTLDPTAIEYYIAVMDAAGQLLSTAGSEAQPFNIGIVTPVTIPPPAIPDEEPMSACQEECPPWNPDCNDSDCGKYADLCSESEPCCSGMACVDGVCDESGVGEGTDENVFVNTKGANTKIRFFVNGGVGFGLITEKEYYKTDFPNMRGDEGVKAKTGVAFSKMHLRVGAMFALTEKFELGLNFRGDLPLFSEHYDVLVPSVIANAAYRIAGTNAEKGFQMFGVIGFGWVQLMHRVPYKDCLRWADVLDDDGVPTGDTMCIDEDGDPDVTWKDDPDMQVTTSGFRRSGYLGAEFGFDMNYWFVKNVGVNVGTIFDVTFPTFAFNLDVQAGLALRF